MLLELGIMACVQLGYRYLTRRSSSDKPIDDDPRRDEANAPDENRDAADPAEPKSPSPSEFQPVQPTSSIPQDPYGIPLSIGSFALAAFGASVPLQLLSTAIISYTVAPVQTKAWKDWSEKRQINNDALFSIFSTLALASGITAPIAFSYMSYEVGTYLLRKTSAETQKNTFDGLSQLPRSVWLSKDGVETQIAGSEVQVGDIVVVHSGEVIPVDGQIIAGQALIDQHQLTGEAQPAAKEEGDWVLASTLVAAGRIMVKTAKTGNDTNVAHIARTLVEIAQTKPEVIAQGEQIADTIALPVLALSSAAFLGFGLPEAIIVLNSGFGNRIRVLGPLSTLNYLNIASRRGILVKKGTALEQITRIDTVLFDKTGTLTLPTLKIGRITTYHGYDAREILAYAASAEQQQGHPIAKAILQAARELQLDLPACDDTSYRVGYGVTVKLANGPQIRVGNGRFMESEGISRPEQMLNDVARTHEAGASLVVVAVDDRVAGTIVIEAQVRPEVPEIIQGLSERGIEHMAIVSGDHAGPTRLLAESLAIKDAFAEVLPTDKANIVRTLQEQGRVVCFIGDGVNDSVAMQQADVSISLSGASTIATDCAAIVMMDGSLKHLCELFDLAKKLDANTRRSVGVFGSFSLLNLGGTVVGMGIDGSVALKALSTLAVIGNTAFPLVEEEVSARRTE